MYMGPDADDDSNYVLWVYPAGDEEADVVCKIKQQKIFNVWDEMYLDLVWCKIL